MNICVFAYEFPHWKTHHGLINLILNGYKPDIIFAQQKLDLPFYQSKIRTSVRDQYLITALDISKQFEIEYCKILHSDIDKIISKGQYDLGIILGARILPQKIIDLFNIGILNMHPGILPCNRGLDNIKWSIIDNLPVGVTTHLIDNNIDRGLFINNACIPIYKDDSFIDLCIRNINLEQKLMIESLNMLSEGFIPSVRLGKGVYYKSVPWQIEKQFNKYFKKYVRTHAIL